MNTVMIVYGLTLLANTILSFYVWQSENKTIYRSVFLLWGGMFLNISLQAIFTNLDLFTILSFSTYLISSYAFLLLNLELTDQNKKLIDYKKINLWTSIFYIASITAWVITKHFTISAFLMSLAIVLPQLLAVNEGFKNGKKLKSQFRIYNMLLALNAIHLLDYAFLRPNENMAIWGYTFAIIIIFLISILVPVLVISKNSLQLKNTLERKIQERTTELASAVKFNDGLVSIICHDLSSPVTILNIYLDDIFSPETPPHILKKRTRPEIKERCERSLSQVNTIISSVKRLHLKRLGFKNLEIDDVGIYKCIEEAANYLQEKLNEKNISLNVLRSKQNDIIIRVDRLIFVNQVLVNLLTNAIKFSHAHSKIDIEAKQDGPHVSLEVTDYGIGIPSTLLNNIFELSHTKNSRLGTLNELGTGLGLPIAHSCLSMMGGEINVLSYERDLDSLDPSTVFKLSIPAAI